MRRIVRQFRASYLQRICHPRLLSFSLIVCEIAVFGDPKAYAPSFRTD